MEHVYTFQERANRLYCDLLLGNGPERHTVPKYLNGSGEKTGVGLEWSQMGMRDTRWKRFALHGLAALLLVAGGVQPAPRVDGQVPARCTIRVKKNFQHLPLKRRSCSCPSGDALEILGSPDRTQRGGFWSE